MEFQEGLLVNLERPLDAHMPLENGQCHPPRKGAIALKPLPFQGHRLSPRCLLCSPAFLKIQSIWEGSLNKTLATSDHL